MMPWIAGIAVSVGVMFFLSAFVAIYFLRMRKGPSSSQETGEIICTMGV